MRHYLVAAFAAVSMLLFSSNIEVEADSNHPALLDSIAPLQSTEYNPNTGQNEIRNYCTAGFIDEVRHYWLTAAHCVDATLGKNVRIAGFQGVVVAVDKDKDLAIILTHDLKTKPLRLAKRAPKLKDKVETAGYSFGYSTPHYFTGVVSLLSITFSPEDAANLYSNTYTMFDLPTAPGQSGSPVIDEDGRVISIIQIGYGRGFSVVSGGVRWSELVAFAESFFGR